MKGSKTWWPYIPIDVCERTHAIALEKHSGCELEGHLYHLYKSGSFLSETTELYKTTLSYKSNAQVSVPLPRT